MRKISTWVLVFTFILVFGTTAFAKEITLDIYSVNDFHGALEKTDKNIGIAELAGFLKVKTQANKENILLLSAGDMFTGTLDSGLSKGEFVVDCMNKMGFDAMAIGNHEFDWGLATLNTRIKQAKFPVLAANIWYKDSKKPLAHVKPYIILEKAGLKIGVIGIATPQTAYTANPKIVQDLVFANASLVVQNVVKDLQNKVDLIIVLSHLGSLQDAQNNISDEAYDLAENVEGVATIVSGHTHKKVSGKVNNIPIVQADWAGRAVGHIKLVYDTTSKEVVRSFVEVISLEPNHQLSDKDIAQAFEKYHNNIIPLKNKIVGNLKNRLAHDKMTFSPLGKYITSKLREHTSSDIAILTGGNIRSSLEAGAITYGMIFNAFPFDNSVCTVEMTGEQILRLLEQGLFKDTHGGALQFSGMNVVTDKNNISGQRIQQVILSDGSDLDLKKSYKVATIDYLIDGGDQLTVFTEVSKIDRSYDKLVEVLVEEFAKQNQAPSIFELIDISEQKVDQVA